MKGNPSYNCSDVVMARLSLWDSWIKAIDAGGSGDQQEAVSSTTTRLIEVLEAKDPFWMKVCVLPTTKKLRTALDQVKKQFPQS